MFSFSTKKSLTSILLAVLALSLSGCVYLRLFELKKQLARFDENFKTQSDDGIAIRCLHPVLLGDDLRWLGAEPKTITTTVDGERWDVRWIKEPPPGVAETAVYDVEVGARFIDEHLAEVHIPERYFAYFPKELFLNLIRSAGAAKVDRGARKAESQTEATTATPMPGLGPITSMLGQPTRQEQEGETTLYMYRYRAETDVIGTKPIEVTFVFDSASGVLRRLNGQLPHGAVSFDFSKAKPTADADRASTPVAH